MNYLEHRVTESDRITFIQKASGFGRSLYFQSEELPLCNTGCKQRLFTGMDQKRKLKLIMKKCRPQDMVNVAMCVDYLYRFQVILLKMTYVFSLKGLNSSLFIVIINMRFSLIFQPFQQGHECKGSMLGLFEISLRLPDNTDHFLAVSVPDRNDHDSSHLQLPF
jgi:hypothetical protein